MKLWYRFVCAFVAVAVVLFSVRVPDVDADEVLYHNESQINVVGDGFSDFLNNYNCDDYDLYKQTMIDLALEREYDLSKDYIFACYINETELAYVYNFYYVQNGVNVNITFDSDIIFSNTYIHRCSYSVIKSNSAYSNISINNSVGSQTMLFDSSNFYKYNNYVFLSPELKKIKFIVNPELFDSMDMNNLNTNFTIDVENETDNAYNYCIYISSQPASVGIVNSLQSANYFLSSKQWCYVFQQDYQLDADLLDQIKNNVSDNYTTTDIIDYMLRGAPITNLTNVWGGVYNGAKEYIALKNNSMSFYSLVQTNCPVYLIRSNSTRSHVVDYASLNVNLDTQYYLNIIYYQPDMNVVGAIGSSTAALVSAATGEDMIYPIYNVDFFRDYTVYDSIPFSFVNGTFSISEDDVTKYNDVVQNSNPANSTANISSDDDNVNINNSNSYDSSVKTNYYNYGTIYHNCSWSGSCGSSGSGSRPSVPELPDAEFENLYDQSGNFFDFVADVLDAVGAVPMLFITAAFAVLLFLRIWGR